MRVISKGQPRIVKTKDGQEHRVVDAYVGDRTGTISLALWDERIEEVEVGDVIDIKNGYVNRFKGKPRLNIGRFGGVEKVEDDDFPSIGELSAPRRTRRRMRHTG